VWVTVKSGEHPLLQVRVAGSKRQQLFLIDPQGGSLAVDANGGPGGVGGSGGRGGHGGRGGSGSPPGFSGQDGRNGFDGLAGAPGAAGTIQVSMDPSAQAFADRIHLSNKGGNGAAGKTPLVQIEPVPPLW
jgi:hypothetical protein